MPANGSGGQTPSRRGYGRWAAGWVYTVLVLLAVALILGISERVSKDWDLSRGSANSLAPQTIETLAGLKEDVHVTALFSDDGKRRSPRDNYWRLLKSFRERSRHVIVDFYDPIERPGVVKALGLNTAGQSGKVDGVTVVQRGDRKLVFEGSKEEDVTNAILEIGSSRERVVGILRGCGERDPSSTSDAGFSRATQALVSEYYKVMDVSLSEGIPPDVVVLIVPGPRMPLSPADLAKLEAWLQSGGRLLALLDAEFDTGIGSVLENWGLRMLPERVEDTAENINGSKEIVKVATFTTHPVVRGFSRSFPIAFPLVAPVENFEPGDPRVFHDGLALTGRYAISVDADGARKQGPFDVAAAAWRPAKSGKETETRVILVGDSDFAANAYLLYGANRNFLLNCVAWLSRAEEFVSVRSATMAGQAFTLSPGDGSKLLAAVLCSPLLVIIAGVLMFVRRRGL